jgi:hypothetical protein
MIMNLRVIKNADGLYLIHTVIGPAFTARIQNSTIFDLNDEDSKFVHDMYCKKDISYRSVPIEIKEI